MKIKKWNRSIIFIQSTFLLLLIFLAIVRWFPGADPLSPEEGSRGWIEVAFFVIAMGIMAMLWGVKPFIAGFSSPTFIVLIIFSIWAMLSSIWAPNHIVALGKSGSLFAIVLLTVGIAYQASRFNLQLSNIIIVAMVMLVLFLFVINKMSFNSFFPIDWTSSRPRFSLGYNHPNETASYFTTLLLCCLPILKTKKVPIFILIILLMLLLFIPLYLTDSRTSMIALIINIVVYFVVQSKSMKFKIAILLIVFLGGLLILVLLLNGSIQTLLFRVTNNSMDFSSIDGRLKLWFNGFQNISAFNIVGNGYYSSRFQYLADFNWGYSSHNTYIEVYLTTGIIGFSLLLLYYLSTYKVINKSSQFALAFSYLIYASLESMMETRLFDPSIIMTITCLLIFSVNVGSISTIPYGETYD